MYYTLVVYDLDAKRWIPEFGDPDKAVVIQERLDWIESGGFAGSNEKRLVQRPCYLRILRTAADEGQRGIDLAVEELTQWGRLLHTKAWHLAVFSSPKTALVDAR